MMEKSIDRDGKVYDFDREALQDKKGGIELSQLRDDEIIIAPGLIYRKSKASKPRGNFTEVTCRCGTKFMARPADIRRGWGKSCSKSCAAQPK
jgi:hypothetical protein